MQQFPAGFLWGAATAAHQIEGHNVHSDWWRAEQAGRLPFRSGAACDSWNRWPEDVRLLRQMGLNAYRLGIEWARIEPAPGRVDQAAVDTYRRQLEALRAAGIEPLVTLHHFTSPAWLADLGGWGNPEIVPRLADFAALAAREFGSLVRWWITINEPTILAVKGYLEGQWPPFRRFDLRGFSRLLRAAPLAHAAARSAIRAQRADAQASMAFAIWPSQPLRAWSPIDVAMARLGDWLWQERVLRRSLKALDWIGVNYYSRTWVGWPPPTPTRPTDPESRTDFGWEIYPEGLYTLLRRVGRFEKPIIITENGISDADDDQRPSYIVRHLEQVQRAIADGVDVRGYLHWTLMDNFEWAEGTTQRFGLAATNFTTFERSLRPSAALYGSIARANRLLPEVLAPDWDGTFSVT